MYVCGVGSLQGVHNHVYNLRTDWGDNYKYSNLTLPALIMVCLAVDQHTYHQQLIGSSTLCSKKYASYSPMLLNVAYYAVDSYPLFLFTKNHTTQIHAFKVHSSSSQAIQYNCTTELPRM